MGEWRFEWDNEKAAANLRTHSVPFQEVVMAFCDPFAIEWIDDRQNYGEERINMLAMIRGTIFHVTYS